jgi:hypothetical protein
MRRNDMTTTRQIADEALYRSVLAEAPSGEGLLQPAWFIDPSNSTGNANDSNTGVTAGSPLLTFKELVARWGTNSPPLAQDTTITFLSSQPNMGLGDPIKIYPQLLGIGASLFFVGSLTKVATDRISTYTPRNRTAGTLDSIIGTNIPNFAGFNNLLCNAETVGSVSPQVSVTIAGPIFDGGPAVTLTGTPNVPLNPIEVDITSPTTFSWSINGVVQQTGLAIGGSVALGTTGITANFPAGSYSVPQFYQAFTSGWFWIDSTSGSSATITAPMVQGIGINWAPPFTSPPWMTIANGSTLTIYQNTQINVQACKLQNAGFVENPFVVNEIYFEQLQLLSPAPPAVFIPNYLEAEGCTFQMCRLDSTQVTQGQVFGGSINCLQNGGFFGGAANFYGGSIDRTGTLNIGTTPDSRGVVFDGDIIINSDTPLKVFLGNVVFGFAYLSATSLTIGGSSDAFLSATDERVRYVAQAGAPFAALWGPGNIAVSNGNAFRVVNAGGVTPVTATGSILLTAAPPITLDGLSSATFSKYAAGTWTAGIAPTPANVDADGAVINPITDTRICLNGANDSNSL